MRPTIALLSVLLLFSLAFPLNVSQSIDGDKLSFRIDGRHFIKTDLSIFVFVDGVQTQAFQAENVTLPYYHYLPYQKGGFYEFRALNKNNASDYGSAKAEIPNPASAGTEAEVAAQDDLGTKLAMAAGMLGLVVIGYFLVSFIKIRNDKK